MTTTLKRHPNGSPRKSAGPAQRKGTLFEIFLWTYFTFFKCVRFDLENGSNKTAGDPPTAKKSHAERQENSQWEGTGSHFVLNQVSFYLWVPILPATGPTMQCISHVPKAEYVKIQKEFIIS